MKRTGFLIALSLISSLAFSQGIGTAEIVSESHLTGPLEYRTADALKAPNGDLIFFGEVSDTNDELYVLRTNSAGATIWSRTFPRPGGAGEVFAQAGTVGADGKIYIVCAIEGSTDVRDFWFVELNGIGIKLNERVVDHFNNDYQVGGIKVAPDGSVYFSGGGLDPSQPLLVKMDASLNTIWSYALGNPAATTSQYVGGFDIAADNSVVASCEYSFGSQLDIQFVRLDPAGGLVYEKILGDATLSDRDPKVLIGSDGFTYFTYSRASITASAEARLSQYDSAGNFQWNKSEAGFGETAFLEMPFGGFVFAMAKNSGTYENKLFQFDTSGSIIWSRTVTKPNLDFNSTAKFVVDDEGILTLLSYTSQSGQIDGDWLIQSFSNTGVPLYQWSYDNGVGQYDIPTGLVPQGNGQVLATGFTGGDLHTYQLRPVLLVQPNSATVRLGRLNAGNVSSLYADDNNYYEMCKFIVPNLTVAPINVEFDSVVPADYPIRDVSFETTVKANTPGLQQDTQMWNWLNSTWDPSTLTGLSLSEVSTSVDGAPDPNVEGLTRRVRSRIRVKAVGPVTVNLWCVQIDKVGWRIVP